ncbi:uncharacterized protein LOC128241900 isoform X2 [Mya arenaria]|uniref:uncharacterized protein LOC128241900 isoform X2 n=1 Tax=Mya arenaria TaxID=6604 RepID=UPI0022E036A0|nr:uncharacterized protein LOC128241900 isoform X2 [Mya arenaria]
MACSGEEGEQNHAKLIQLEKPVQNTLKALLENETTKQATTIDQLLFNHRKSFRRIGKSAQHLLFPQGNQPPNPDAWDLSLSCNVLRNCFLMQTAQENDVNAVRTTRNDIHHLAKPFISNADYAKYTHVYKSFITNTLNYINDQDLKAVINEQVQEAERPVSKQVIEMCHFFHKSYFSNADDVNGINENIDEKHDILFEELQELKRFISTLSKESQSKLKPPDIASFKLLIKECSPDEEKKISQILVRIFGEELGKKCNTLPDDTCEALKDVVRKLLKRFQEQAELIYAEYGCVCIFTRFYDFLSYMDFLDDLVNGKLTKIALPLQNALRCCFGIEDLQVELVMEDEQFLQCFKNTLDCVKNVHPSLKKTTRESDQCDKTLPNSAAQSPVHSDAPVADAPDIIMSTFYTELDNNIDLTISKNDANKYGMVLKDAIEIFIAGQSQRQAPAVGAEREVKRLTKESNKAEEESISPTGKDQVQSNPGEAMAIRLTKQYAESADGLMLQNGTGEEQSPWVKAEELGIRSKEQSFGIIDETLLHQGPYERPVSEVTVREIKPLVRFDQKSSDEETYGWSPKNQKLKKSIPNTYGWMACRLVTVTLLCFVLVVPLSIVVHVTFEKSGTRSRIKNDDLGRSDWRPPKDRSDSSGVQENASKLRERSRLKESDAIIEELRTRSRMENADLGWFNWRPLIEAVILVPVILLVFALMASVSNDRSDSSGVQEKSVKTA